VRFAPLATAIAVGFDALRANLLRTVLSTLGVIIGVSALVAVLSVGDGLEHSVRTQIAETTDLQAVNVSARTREEVDGQFFPLANPATLTVDDARKIKALPGAGAVLLRANSFGEVRNLGGTVRRMARVVSEVVLSDSTGPAVAAGRLLSTEESAGSTPIVVISFDLAQALAPDSIAATMVGDSLQLGTIRAVVAGVLEPRPAPRVVQVPGARRRPPGDYHLTAPLGLVRVAGLPGQPPAIIAVASTVEETQPLRQRIERMFAASDTAWARHFAVTTNEGRLEQLSRGILMFKLFMGAITGISLLVGGIGIMNVLLSSVTERTREIGIRKAAGARDRDILRQFLAESVAISSLGSFIGLALGIAGAYGITAGIRRFSQAPSLYASVSWSTVLVAAVAAVIVGLTFGTYPARRAARLSPIDAIRHE
jgi:putative ABC transport system permease protein